MALLDAPAAAAPGLEMPAAPAVDPRYDLANPEATGKITRLVREKTERWARGGREGAVKNAWRNILFKRLHQWLSYDRSRSWWRPISTSKYTGPRPVFNRFGSTMGAFASVLARVEPSLTFRPASDDPEDRAAAEVAERILEVCERECNLRLQRQLLAQWVAYTGDAWLESGYDPSPEHGMRLVQDQSCPACGAVSPPSETGMCLACGGPTVPAVDEAGEPVGAEVPIGKMYTEVATVFEMYFDNAIEDWTQVREYVRKKSIDPEAATRRWGARADSARSDLSANPGEAYQDQLATLAAYQPETGPGAGSLPLRGAPAGGRVSETWYWALPTEDYPEGVLAIILGGVTVVHLGPLPYQEDDRPFLPTVKFSVDPVPGSGYGHTPANDLALVVVTRNMLIAHMLMTMNRMAWPIWVVPEGTNVSQFSGEAGQVLRYNALGPNPAKPERMAGAGLPNGAVTWLQYLDQEIEELAACLTGATKVPCLDGVTRTMQELAEQFPAGGMWVYGFDLKSQRIVPAQVEKAWLTGTKRCVRVTFKEGTEVECSYDHPFLTWERGYVKAEDLRPDDSIVPLNVMDNNGYNYVYQPMDHQFEGVHRMVGRAKWGVTKGDGLHVHHKRKREKRNNLPDNLEVKQRGRHISEHLTEWWQEADQRAKDRRINPMLSAMREYWSALSLSARSALAKARQASLDPEIRLRTSRAAIAGRKPWTAERRAWRSEKNRQYWASQTPERRQEQHEKMRANHRVLIVEPIGNRQVYDLQTSTQNFGLDAGVIVKNTFAVMKGDRPPGVSAGIALQMLQERANHRFGPMFILWEQAHTGWGRQQLAIFRQFATEPRLLKIQGHNSQWRVRQFLGADLSGTLDIVAEAGSGAPRSTLVERAELEQLSANGVVDATDPEIKEKWLEAYHRRNWLPGMQADSETAAKQVQGFTALAENPQAVQIIAQALQQGALWTQATQQPVTYDQIVNEVAKAGLTLPRVRPQVDGHSILARELGTWLKGDESQALPPPIQQVVEMKHAQHIQIAQQQMLFNMQLRSGTFPTSGFLSNPGGQQGAVDGGNGASPRRMDGEQREQEARAT